jgi:hypothetical protein
MVISVLDILENANYLQELILPRKLFFVNEYFERC